MKQTDHVHPATVLRCMAKSRRVWLYGVLLLAAPIMAGVCLQKIGNNKICEKEAQRLLTVADCQATFIADTLDSVSLIMNENTSNIHYIDVGLTDGPDDEIEAALACSELKTYTEMHKDINSAYLVCNLNHTIYNSLDSMGYADDEFYDLSWRQQYDSAVGGMQLLDTVRTVHTPYRQEDRYISLVSRVPYFSTLQNKCLVYNISVQDLGDRLVAWVDSAEETVQGKLWIYNSRGELIWDQSGKTAPETYAELALGDALQSGTRGWQIATWDSLPYLVAQVQESTYGWKFVQVLPCGTLRESFREQNRNIWLAMAVLFLAGEGCFLLSSYQHHKRELAAAWDLQQKTEILPDVGEDGLAYLQRVGLGEAERGNRQARVLSSFSGVIQEHVVLSLIHGEALHKEEAQVRKSVMERMGLLGEEPQKYLVFLARIEAISAMKLNLHQDIYSQFQKMLQYGCNERLLEEYHACYAWADHSLLAAIVCMPADMHNKEILQGLNQMGQAMQKQLTLLSEQQVVIAFGNVMEDPWNLVESYEHAKQLIQHKIYYHKDVPYTYSEKMEADLQMSYDNQKKLVDQIKLGKIKEASELLESYFTILHNNPYTEIEQVRKIGVKLADVISNAVAGRENQLEDKFADVKKLQARLQQMGSVHDVADCLVEYVQAAAGMMQEQLQGKKDMRVQEVLEWIRNHYNQDISLDDVAEQMGLSATYASKQIKAYTGTNVVNYINNLRIEHAKELLAGTKMSSNEIGAYVGFRYSQSFIRTFRKVVGMTPGNYRSLHQKGENVTEETEKTSENT